ncbi:DUF1835 domain-containing protein [Oceanobacillus neutriphilus]|uniref:Uncharacterized protein n=1 Tax=Oceanobacillus neutriphilus TaxID=531815 RepID=A0ABQ2P1R8_9BACI|nr:DUF1835 domain-containing protein [Oceanobacillus neutriphilus]GGP16115.1 hypothetical protein GCM10011346_46800 [Oceanobacillus neutriphilus]
MDELKRTLKNNPADKVNSLLYQTDLKSNNNGQAIHILFGDSASGSLKWALKEKGIQDKEKVISLSDLFSIGPVWQLHDKAGLDQRNDWIKNHLILDDDINEVQLHFNNTLSMINAIPENDCYPLHTGEIIPEKLMMIYEKRRKVPVLSQEQRKKFEEEWKELAATRKVLRAWENKEIKSVDDDYYDDFIIKQGKKAASRAR